jgi:ParB family transcriptional regulator, chromosome partitioning protein
LSDTKGVKKLGRGLSGLLGQPVSVNPAPVSTQSQIPAEGAELADGKRLLMIPLTDLAPNRYQPRKSFDAAELAALAQSIKAAGLMQPVIIRATGTRNKYELIAGERRFRAAGMAGLTAIPSILVEADERMAAAWAVMENVAREDLNIMDKARALKRLAEEFGMTHERIAEEVGESRTGVTNLIRLCELPENIQYNLEKGELTFGHAKVLLGLPVNVRSDYAAEAVVNRWTVRDLEEAVRRGEGGHGLQRSAKDPAAVGEAEAVTGLGNTQVNINDLEQQLSAQLGTKVRLETRRQGKAGRVVIEFYSIDHFEGLLARLGVKVGGL